MIPTIIKGDFYKDNRGILRFNNNFDTSIIKRIYIIENKNSNLIRAWQGHQIEKRWYTVVDGIFKIQLIKIDNWNCPSKKNYIQNFIIDSNSLDVLYIPGGYVSSIQSITDRGKLLVMADYNLNEIKDDYRFSLDYFI